MAQYDDLVINAVDHLVSNNIITAEKADTFTTLIKLITPTIINLYQSQLDKHLFNLTASERQSLTSLIVSTVYNKDIEDDDIQIDQLLFLLQKYGWQLTPPM
jgi:hypothetical protein